MSGTGGHIGVVGGKAELLTIQNADQGFVQDIICSELLNGEVREDTRRHFA